MQPALIVLDHKQPATLLNTDSFPTEGFVDSGMKQKRSKMWDIKWHYLRYKEVLEQLRVYWDIGMNNDADYFTKHHPPIRHRQMRPRCINALNLLITIPYTIRLCDGMFNPFLCNQSCINSLKPIRAEPQYMIAKYPIVRHLNRSR